MNKPETVWIIDDDKSIRWVVEKALQKADIVTRSFSSAQSCWQHFRTTCLMPC